MWNHAVRFLGAFVEEATSKLLGRELDAPLFAPFVTLWNLGGGGCKTSRHSFVCGTCQARGILYIVKLGKSGVQRCNPDFFLSSCRARSRL